MGKSVVDSDGDGDGENEASVAAAAFSTVEGKTGGGEGGSDVRGRRRSFRSVGACSFAGTAVAE